MRPFRTMAGAVVVSRTHCLELPFEQAVEGYRAMDERRAIKVLLRPWPTGRPQP
jgi:hypothetical protein